MSEPLIRLQHVSVRFGQHQVLRDVSLDIFPQQTVAFIGESGCGKTVTLKLIVGLLQPTDGEVLFEGKNLRSLSERELTAMRLRVGFLFQSAALFDSLSVFDNVAFGLKAKGGVSADEIQKRVRERVKEVGLPEASEAKMPSELSGGMRKRVGLARALALDPAVMLYDEPTTGLDPIMTDVINELILQTREKRPVTSIIVTHEMRTVRKVADRVVMFYPLAKLADGERQVVFDGPPDQLAEATDPRVRQFVEGRAGEAGQESGGVHGFVPSPPRGEGTRQETFVAHCKATRIHHVGTISEAAARRVHGDGPRGPYRAGRAVRRRAAAIRQPGEVHRHVR